MKGGSLQGHLKQTPPWKVCLMDNQHPEILEPSPLNSPSRKTFRTGNGEGHLQQGIGQCHNIWPRGTPVSTMDGHQVSPHGPPSPQGAAEPDRGRETRGMWPCHPCSTASAFVSRRAREAALGCFLTRFSTTGWGASDQERDGDGHRPE